MAIIPQYKPQTRREPMPGVRHQVSANANTFGAGVYGAQGQLADLLYQRGLKKQEEQDDAAVMGATADYLRELNTRTYGPDGFLSAKGTAAIDVTQRAVKDMDELQNQFMGSLKNRRQQEMFSKMAFGYKNNVMTIVSRHEAQEHQVYIKENHDAFISATQSTAVFAQDDASFKAAMEPAILEIKKRHGPYGEAVVQAETKKFLSGTHLLRAQHIYTNDPAAAADYLEKNEGDIVPEDMQKFISLKAATKEKVKEDQRYKVADDLIKKYTRQDESFDVEGAKAEAKRMFGEREEAVNVGVEPVDESALRFSRGDNPDWAGVTAATKSGVLRLWPGITAIAEAVITSGYRDPERNQHAKGVKDSDHLSGNAVDIVFLRNLSKSEEQNITEQAKALGFEKVIWHDAGSGYHLHVANYKGESGTKTTRTIPADYGSLDFVNRRIEAHDKDVLATARRRENDAEEQLLNDLALLGPGANLTDQLDLVDKAVGLQPHVRANIKANLVGQVKSEDSTIASLDRLVAQKHLTVEDVESMRPYLNHKDYLTYRKQSYEIEAGTYNKEQVAVENQWHSYLKLMIKDSSKHDQLQNDIKAMLEGYSGQERLSKAYDFIDKAAKNNQGIFLFSKNNNLERQQLIDIYGEKFVSLLEQGLSKDKFRNTWGGSYGKMSAWMATLGEKRKTDLALGAAIDYLLENNYGINPDSIDEAYKTFSGKQSIPRFATTEDVDVKTNLEELENAMIGGTD